MDPLSFLYSLERLGMKFGLENISRLCDALGHPERAFQSIIIAGTNGKGSVTAMTQTALSAAGRRTARYTSPHLTRLEERFVIDGLEVGTDDLHAALARVQEISTDLAARGAIDSLPTFFECATAAAFELFRRRDVEIAVLEVGLGGRLDATNVVTPVAAAITSIDFDHQAQLGDTIESIAGEKAGVIKPGIPVVCGPLPPQAMRVIGEQAAACRATVIDSHRSVRVTEHDDGSLDLETDHRRLQRVRLALRGRHQIANAAVVVALLDAMRPCGIEVDDGAARTGLMAVRWPGRLELVRVDGADILLDAAHNPAGAAALASYLREIGWTEVVLLFGAMQDKDVRGMIAPLAPLCSRIVCTTAPSPRALPAAPLAELARAFAACPVDAVDAPAAAIARARRAGARIVAAGSIFLIGPLRGILR